MARKKKERPLIEQVEITDIAAEGKAIAKKDDLVVFVTNAVPGDIVDIRVVKKKKNYLEGHADHFHRYSELREEPFCEHFGICGGCKWQQLPYHRQLFYKEKQVRDAMERLGKVTVKDFKPIIASPDHTYYRNKLEFNFSNNRWLYKSELKDLNTERQMNALGFHVRGRFDKIVDIKKCFLQKDPSNDIRLEMRKFAIENGYSFYDLKKHTGFLRNIIIRITELDEVMLIVCFAYEDKELRKTILNHILHKFPEITSLLYLINPKLNDTINDLDIHLFHGRDHIFEQLGDLKFKISPKSFFQTNSKQAVTLFNVTKELAGLTGEEIVYDLYTGTGSIANYLADKSKKVIGIESIPEAVDDANVNSELNNINNIHFHYGDVKDLLTPEFFGTHGYPDVMITDPPRSGMHPDVIKTIIKYPPQKLVYVSCNPATQARDIEQLSGLYSVEVVQAVDMFPHTNHVENVALLRKK